MKKTLLSHEPMAQFSISHDPEELRARLKVVDEEIEMPRSCYSRPWIDPSQKDAGSTMSIVDGKLEILMDVQQFSPEELTVTTEGVYKVVVEGQQKDKEEFGGLMDRYFKRKFFIPSAFDSKNIECKMSSDGILFMSLPRLNMEEDEEKLDVPIAQTEEYVRDRLTDKMRATKLE